MLRLSKNVKIVGNCQKLSEIVKKLSKLSKKIVKTLKNCQNSQKLYKLSKIVKNCQKFQKIVKVLVRSCFLITLIKCLKGHKSLGLLCNVKSKSPQ